MSELSTLPHGRTVPAPWQRPRPAPTGCSCTPANNRPAAPTGAQNCWWYRLPWQTPCLSHGRQASGPGRAHPYQVLTAVKVNQLIGIDTDGGTPHSGAHDRYRPAHIGSRVAKHVSGPVKLLHVLQKMLRNILCPQGSPGSRIVSAISPFSAPIWGVGVLDNDMAYTSFSTAALCCLSRPSWPVSDGLNGLPYPCNPQWDSHQSDTASPAPHSWSAGCL